MICFSEKRALGVAALFLATVIVVNSKKQNYNNNAKSKYTPDWESLDARPLPSWYDQAKVGVFFHWGVFSVPSFRSEWFWWYWQGKGNPQSPDVKDFMNKNYPPNFKYADFAPEFKAEFYDPDYWSDIIKASGAKYAILSTKHHEGYCLWPTKHSFNWNAAEVGPKRDLIGDFAAAIRKNNSGVKFGVYHSLFEWFNPIHLADAAKNYTTQRFVRLKSMPELYELVENYSPDIIWSDGDSGPDTYWNSTEFLAWLYNESQVKETVVTNDRWGNNGCACRHGGYYTCADRYNPGSLQNHKWENAMTLDTVSWGYRRNARLEDIMSIEDLVNQVVSTVSCGGNILINTGPSKEGTIAPIYEERLRQLGSWLDVNGEAIYNTKPWKFQNDTTNSNVWYTTKNSSVYAILIEWSSKSFTITSPKNTNFKDIRLLGYDKKINWVKTNESVTISTRLNGWLPSLKWAWVFELQNITTTSV